MVSRDAPRKPYFFYVMENTVFKTIEVEGFIFDCAVINTQQMVSISSVYNALGIPRNNFWNLLNRAKMYSQFQTKHVTRDGSGRQNELVMLPISAMIGFLAELKSSKSIKTLEKSVEEIDFLITCHVLLAERIMYVFQEKLNKYSSLLEYFKTEKEVRGLRAEATATLYSSKKTAKQIADELIDEEIGQTVLQLSE